ncbi:MAG: hypothetical protein O3A51_10700 [Verrucomicrobia bacterium]|nr:hypothetical protein [Verrucomicrobiota bacterium]
MKTIQDKAVRFVEACIRGIHAHQVDLHRRSGNGDPKAFGPTADTPADLAPSIKTLRELVDTAFIESQKGWPSDNPKIDAWINSLLALPAPVAAGHPLTVMEALIKRESPQTPTTDARAIASLFQLTLFMGMDVPVLLKLNAIYHSLGMPIYLEQVGILADPATFKDVGGTLAAASVAAPYPTDGDAWWHALQKIHNWGERAIGKHTHETYAAELLQKPTIQACLPALRQLTTRRIGVIGHSYTMNQHWASHGSFAGITHAILKSCIPDLMWHYEQGGNLTPTRALTECLPGMLAFRPDRVLLVMTVANPLDQQSLTSIIHQLQQVGADVFVFDCFRMSEAECATLSLGVDATATAAGATVIEVADRLHNHPERNEFLAIDDIHTRPPYHKVLAEELIACWAGQRPARLSAISQTATL